MIKLLPFQIIGQNFLAARRNAILADDMGIGKTYQSLCAARKVGAMSGLIITPHSMRRTWTLRIRDIFPEAFIKEITSPKIFPEANAFNVVNYDIVWKEPLITMLKEVQWPVLICDESHYLRTSKSKRTKAILGRNGIFSRCLRRWMLTGTPILSRPIELYPVLRSLFPEKLGKYTGFYDFAYKFCAGYQGAFGFDCTGASNLRQLSDMLGPIMLRRLRAEVQPELPTVRYDKVYLDPTNKLMALIKKERAEFDSKKLTATASARQALGVIKTQAAIKHLRDMLEETGKVVVFMWHKEVAHQIHEAFPEISVLYTGAQTASEKEEAKRRFIEEEDTKIFIGNIASAGIGIDGLQHVCSNGLFVEMSYIPKEIEQCIGRLDRMGQTSPVNIQFLIAESSKDEDLINTLVEKSENINVILNERRGLDEIAFIQTRCHMCGEVKEMQDLKRVLKLSVCTECKKEMECLL